LTAKFVSGMALVSFLLSFGLKSSWWHRHLAGAAHRLESLCHQPQMNFASPSEYNQHTFTGSMPP
jgi:hypothetical protein